MAERTQDGAEDRVWLIVTCFKKSRVFTPLRHVSVLINLFMCYSESMMNPPKSDSGMSHREEENDFLLHDPTWQTPTITIISMISLYRIAQF